MKMLNERQPRRKSRRHGIKSIGVDVLIPVPNRVHLSGNLVLRRTTLRGVVDKSPMVVIKGLRESSIEDKEETGKERFYTRNHDDDNHDDDYDADDDDEHGDDNAKVNKDRRLHNGHRPT